MGDWRWRPRGYRLVSASREGRPPGCLVFCPGGYVTSPLGGDCPLTPTHDPQRTASSEGLRITRRDVFPLVGAAALSPPASCPRSQRRPRRPSHRPRPRITTTAAGRRRDSSTSGRIRPARQQAPGQLRRDTGGSKSTGFQDEWCEWSSLTLSSDRTRPRRSRRG